MNILDLTDQKFGKLTVVKFFQRKPGRTEWVCKCDCGKEKVILATCLKSGNTTSCGCYAIEESIKRKRGIPYKWLYTALKNVCNHKNILLGISFEDFLEYTKTDKCHYCWSKIEWHPHETPKTSHGYNLDRKDGLKGYIKENCVVCCSKCNYGKREYYTYDEWYGMTEYFRNNTINKFSIEFTKNMGDRDKTLITQIKQEIGYK